MTPTGPTLDAPTASRAARWGGVLALCLAAGLALVAPRPALDNRPQVWFPAGDPQLDAWTTLVERFGGDEGVVVLVEGGDPLGGLRLAGDVSDALLAAPGVIGVTSAKVAFPSEVDVLLDPGLGGLSNLKFVGFAFDGPLNRALRLWGREAGRATVLATLRPGSAAERTLLLEALAPLRARAAAEGRALLVAGQPLVNLELDRAAQAVEERAMPLLVAVVVLLLVATTRSLRLAGALLAPVGLGVLATDGALALAGGSTNLVVTIVKPLALVVLLAAGLHVLVGFAEARRGGLVPRAAAAEAVRSRAWPVLISLATSALGFGSLVVSPIGPVRTFGLVCTGAMLLGAPLVLLTLPLLLALLDGASTRPEPSGLGAACAALVAHGRRRWKVWLPVTLVAVVAASACAARLEPQPHAIDYFPADNPLRRDHAALAARGAPLGSIELLVGLPASVGSDSAALVALDAFAAAAGRSPGVRASVSLPLLLREAVHRATRRDRLPDPLLTRELLGRLGSATAPWLTDGGRLARVSLPCDAVGPEGWAAATAAVTSAFAGAGLPAGSRLQVTGSYGLLLGTQRTLLTTLGGSLASTAGLMLLVIALSVRSLRLVLAAVPSNLLSVSSIFLMMGLARVPLDVGTCMTAAIALGIAVDNTLHLLHGLVEHGLDATARTTGRAFVITAVVVGLGFASLLGSDFGPTRNFGLLSAVAVAAALVGDLIVVPAALEALGIDDHGRTNEPSPRAGSNRR